MHTYMQAHTHTTTYSHLFHSLVNKVAIVLHGVVYTILYIQLSFVYIQVLAPLHTIQMFHGQHTEGKWIRVTEWLEIARLEADIARKIILISTVRE